VAAAKKKAQEEYGAQSITILEGLEARPQNVPACISAPRVSAVCTNLVWEVVDKRGRRGDGPATPPRSIVRLLEDGGGRGP